MAVPPVDSARPALRLASAPTAVVFGLFSGGAVTPAILAPAAEAALKKR
jgi:hypothetical protein